MTNMHERKTEVVNLRMTPEIKRLLRRAADHDHRTLSNMLEVLILEYCREHALLEIGETASTSKANVLHAATLGRVSDFQSKISTRMEEANPRGMP